MSSALFGSLGIIQLPPVIFQRRMLLNQLTNRRSLFATTLFLAAACSGPPGPAGMDGRNGQDGASGTQGAMGLPGLTGSKGNDGKDYVSPMPRLKMVIGTETNTLVGNELQLYPLFEDGSTSSTPTKFNLGTGGLGANSNSLVISAQKDAAAATSTDNVRVFSVNAAGVFTQIASIEVTDGVSVAFGDTKHELYVATQSQLLFYKFNADTNKYEMTKSIDLPTINSTGSVVYSSVKKKVAVILHGNDTDIAGQVPIYALDDNGIITTTGLGYANLSSTKFPLGTTVTEGGDFLITIAHQGPTARIDYVDANDGSLLDTTATPSVAACWITRLSTGTYVTGNSPAQDYTSFKVVNGKIRFEYTKAGSVSDLGNVFDLASDGNYVVSVVKGTGTAWLTAHTITSGLLSRDPITKIDLKTTNPNGALALGL